MFQNTAKTSHKSHAIPLFWHGLDVSRPSYMYFSDLLNILAQNAPQKVLRGIKLRNLQGYYIML